MQYDLFHILFVIKYYLIGQHNSVYSANDGRKFIHTNTADGSRVGGCFKKKQKMKLQKIR